MSLIRLILPEDFDERYKKYREELVPTTSMPEPYLVDSLESEKKNLLLIKDELSYQHEMEKWMPLKSVVDAIYKELTPFAEKNQSIQLEISKLGIPSKIANSVFMSLVYERVCRWHLTSPGIISTAPITEYLNGKIVVPSYAKFKEFRQKVHDFCDFMDLTKSEKFPKAPARVPNPEFAANLKGQTAALQKQFEEGMKEATRNGEIIKKVVETLSEKTPFIPPKIQPVVETHVGDEPVIVYNEVTGVGRINGNKFKLKDGKPDYHVFKMLYAKIGKKLERQDVLIAGGFYEDHEKADPARRGDETFFINEIAKSLREKTGLNTEQLVNNDGNLTLVAEKPTKSPPKRPQTAAKWG